MLSVNLLQSEDLHEHFQECAIITTINPTSLSCYSFGDLNAEKSIEEGTDGEFDIDDNLDKKKEPNLLEFFTLLASISDKGETSVNDVHSDQTIENNLHHADEEKTESPDETVLVFAAKNIGFSFLDRTFESMTIDIFGQGYVFDISNVLAFNSSRKRMSIIIRRPETGIVLFCKGAYIIFERLASGQEILIKKTPSDIDNFSSLRTLTVAYRVLDKSFYESWAKKYQEASTAINE
ncbi:40321_t:CDS:2, partial [Gigaspora margarita]